MKMRLGNMDRRIILQSRTVAIDGYGGQGESWANIATVWAQYIPQAMTGTALTSMADQPQFLEKASFVIHYRTDISTDARITYNGAVWKIIGMAETAARDRFLVINAVKTDSDLLG